MRKLDSSNNVNRAQVTIISTLCGHGKASHQSLHQLKSKANSKVPFHPPSATEHCYPGLHWPTAFEDRHIHLIISDHGHILIMSDFKMVENRKYNDEEIRYVVSRVHAGWDPEIIAKAFKRDHGEYWAEREFTKKQVAYIRSTYKPPPG